MGRYLEAEELLEAEKADEVRWGRKRPERLSTLPETNSSHLKMDGWNTFSFPFGIASDENTKVILSERLKGCFNTPLEHTPKP